MNESFVKVKHQRFSPLDIASLRFEESLLAQEIIQSIRTVTLILIPMMHHLIDRNTTWISYWYRLSLFYLSDKAHSLQVSAKTF